MTEVYLECIKEHSRLRVRITSPGYNNQANCQFPRDIRVVGRKFKVPSSAISVAGSEGKGFFYRVKRAHVEQIGEEVVIIPDKIFSTGDCALCLSEVADIVIIPCGHMCMCTGCSKEMDVNHIKDCPMCRTRITNKIHKDKLR